MFLQLFLGGVLITANVTLHAVALDWIIRGFPLVAKWSEKHLKLMHKPLMSALCVLLVFCSHIVQIWIWAAVYMMLPDIHIVDFHTALYFSTTTMTTLGFGDVVIAPPWNLLSAMEAANGFITFGWSTAFTFEIISHLYQREAKFIH